MSATCTNRRLDASERTWLRAARRALVIALEGNERPLIEPVRPLHAYTVLMGEEPHVFIQRRVREAYAEADARNRPVRGSVYVYRDERDGRVSLVKIGSTRKPVDVRIAEWRAYLGASADELAALFAEPSADCRLAERVLHELLFCQWQPKRTRIEDGRRLLEYFDVQNLVALRLLVRAVTRHVNYHTLMRTSRRLTNDD
jgi:hypothetical protein